MKTQLIGLFVLVIGLGLALARVVVAQGPALRVHVPSAPPPLGSPALLPPRTSAPPLPGSLSPQQAAGSAQNVELVGQIGWNSYAVAVQDHYAYVADGGDGLLVVDVVDPTNPTVVGFYNTPGYAPGVAVAGRYAYVADGPSGLRVVDVGDPTHPKEVGAHDTPEFALDVAVAGSYAYVADGGGGLRVINVANQAAPSEVGSYDTPEGALGVTVVGSYAYIADGDAGLRVVDVSDPAYPREVGSYDTPGSAMGVAVAGSYAYVADGWSGLRMVNVSDPAHPTAVGFYDTPGYALGVAVAEGYAYVADDTGGLRVVDVSDPARPMEVGFYDTPRHAEGVAVAEEYAYVADKGSGLLILHAVPQPNLSTSTKQPGTLRVAPEQTVTYTITLANTGTGDAPHARLTDTLPISLTYQAGSLWADGGSYGEAGGVITWTGAITAGSTSTVRYVVVVSPALPVSDTVALANRAWVDDGVHPPLERAAAVFINPYQVQLPLVARGYGSVLEQLSQLPVMAYASAREPVSNSAPSPTATMTPTSTPTGTLTPTPTPATQQSVLFLPLIHRDLVPTPTATATPSSEFPFLGALVRWYPNCAINQVKGHVRNSQGALVNSGVVHLNLYGQIIQIPVGYGSQGEGGYDWVYFGSLLQDPVTVQFYTSSGIPLSNVVEVDFGDNANCLPGQSGHQIAVVDFTCVKSEVCG